MFRFLREPAWSFPHAWWYCPWWAVSLSANALHFTRKSTVSGSSLHTRRVRSNSFCLKADVLSSRMYVPVTSFNFTCMHGILRATPECCSSQCSGLLWGTLKMSTKTTWSWFFPPSNHWHAYWRGISTESLVEAYLPHSSSTVSFTWKTVHALQ